MEFTEAESNMNDLVSEYQQVGIFERVSGVFVAYVWVCVAKFVFWIL